MKALTLYPEHAELFRLGLRFIETRSRSTSYRGALLLHAGVRDPDCAAAHRSPRSQAALAAIPHGRPFVRGAIVASCTLVDVVLIVGEHKPTYPYLHARDALLVTGATVGRDVLDQLPFGDFTPGRYAWLFEDVKPTTERCPRCWGRGEIFWAIPEDDGWADCDMPCPACSGAKACEPIPARGRQGLWEWKP